jgi:RNA-directed DNA polymerase
MKPSHTRVQGVLTNIGTVLTRNVPAGVEPLLGRLTPIITGWAPDHRPWVSQETCAKVAHAIDRNVWRWAKRKHPTQRSRWLQKQDVSASATRRWAFGVTRTQPEGTPHTVRLADMRDTRRRRPIKLRSQANPYAPHWEPYVDARRGRHMQADLHGRRKLGQLWREQTGRCPMCDQALTKATGWNLHHREWRVHGGTDVRANLVLLHPNCHRHVHSRDRVCLQIVGRWSMEYPVESQGIWSFLQEEPPWTTTSS